MSHFIDARFWLDEDGKHVWVRHQCGPRENTAMLPWPTWQANAGGRVEPSVNCRDCDLHVFGQIENPPQDWVSAINAAPVPAPSASGEGAVHG